MFECGLQEQLMRSDKNFGSSGYSDSPWKWREEEREIDSHSQILLKSVLSIYVTSEYQQLRERRDPRCYEVQRVGNRRV